MALLYHLFAIPPNWKILTIWQTCPIWTNLQVTICTKMTHTHTHKGAYCIKSWLTQTTCFFFFCSIKHHSYSIFSTQYLHLLWYRAYCSQSFWPCPTLRTWYHSTILWPSTWWTWTPFIRHCWRCLSMYDPWKDKSNDCCFWWKVSVDWVLGDISHSSFF